MPSTAKAAARVEAARAVLDKRAKVNEADHASLVESLASGDISALRTAKAIFDEQAHIGAARQLTEIALQRIGARLRQNEQEQGRRDRVKVLSAFETLKTRRLATAKAVEKRLRGLATDLVEMEALAGEIEAAYRDLAGERLIVPPLSRSAVGSRVSEFCAGLGLGVWIPVMCAETKPAPTSLTEIENSAQAQYRLSDGQ